MSLDMQTHEMRRRNEFLLDIWWRVNGLLRAEVEGAKSVDSLTVGQFRIIRGLVDGTQSMTVVARLAGVTRGTATRMVDGLVQRGLATRFDDPGNRRVVQVGLTEKGRRLRARSHQQAVDRFEGLLCYMNPAEKKELERLLSIVAKAIDTGASDSTRYMDRRNDRSSR